MKRAHYLILLLTLASLASFNVETARATSEEFDEFAEVFGDDEDDEVDEDADMDDEDQAFGDFDGTISGKEYLRRNAKKDDVVVHESGLQYQVIRSGDTTLGVTHPSATDICTVHYTTN